MINDRWFWNIELNYWIDEIDDFELIRAIFWYVSTSVLVHYLFINTCCFFFQLLMNNNNYWFDYFVVNFIKILFND